MLINVNAGHTLTGGDIGARGINGLKEETLTRNLSNKVAREIELRGHKARQVYVNHADTLAESLNRQVSSCNSVNADLNICIHFNVTPGGTGTEIYTYNGRFLHEADNVLKELSKLGLRNRGIKPMNLALLNRTKAKTVYIEVCFIDNPHDVSILNKNGMNDIAKAIVNGVLGTSTATKQKVSNVDGKIGYVNTPSGVNVREKKSTSSKILGVIPNGGQVILYRDEGEWTHVYYPPHGGYIYSKYLKY